MLKATSIVKIIILFFDNLMSKKLFFFISVKININEKMNYRKKNKIREVCLEAYNWLYKDKNSR
jgi:hypothetical protein